MTVFPKIAVLACALTLSSHAAILRFHAFLDGPSENPPVASPGTGTALVTWDTVALTYSVDASFQGLVGTTTVAHIHCCVDAPGTVGVATMPGTFPGFPVGVTSGTYSNTFDLTLATTFTGGFLGANGGTPAGASAALLQALQDGRAYFNVHSTFVPSGEIRGFLQPVPEPSTIGLAGLALAGALWFRRRTAA